MVIYNHRSNLKRIINGTENKLSFKKKEATVEKEVKKETVENKETEIETAAIEENKEENK